MPLLGWDQGAPKLARGQEAAQGPRRSQSSPSAPQFTAGSNPPVPPLPQTGFRGTLVGKAGLEGPGESWGCSHQC